MAGCIVEVTYPHCAQVQAYLREVRSQFKRYKVQGTGVPSRAIREKVEGLCHSSASPIWRVVGVSWSLVTVVTLAITI
jgi:hypothetical protein